VKYQNKTRYVNREDSYVKFVHVVILSFSSLLRNILSLFLLIVVLFLSCFQLSDFFLCRNWKV